MSLFLVEASLAGIVHSKKELEEKAEKLQASLNAQDATLIELQVSSDFSRTFFIVEEQSEEAVAAFFKAEGINVDLIKEVRLVGDELEKVKNQKDVVNYLVEWNLPENLTMDQYLDRKKTNSVHYEEVPEVSFARTYVCEDMTKCLCFYDAPDEETVKRAREAVKAPIDAITEILNK